jgi:hypothetical protein
MLFRKNHTHVKNLEPGCSGLNCRTKRVLALPSTTFADQDVTLSADDPTPLKHT